MSNEESEDKKYIKNESESENNENDRYDEKSNENKPNEEDDDYKSDEDDDYDAEEDRKKYKKSKLIGNKRKRVLKKKKNKKERNSQNYFLDIQAEEDEEEDSYGGGEITKEQQEKAFKLYDERHFKERNKQMKITDDNEETIIKRLNEKANEPEEEEDYEEVRPTSEDPKLWLIKCKIGDEKDCLANLYHKFFYFQKKEPKDRLKIYSITSFDNLKGKIFIEAFSERDVIYAVTGMSNVNQNSIQLIPINERMKVFEFDKFQKVDINNNQLVRIKHGNYEGDLAKVIYIEDPINKIQYLTKF